MGDLIVTCTSMHSRNRRAGILIGQGKSPQEAMAEIGAVVEGYYAAESIHQLAVRAERGNAHLPQHLRSPVSRHGRCRTW